MGTGHAAVALVAAKAQRKAAKSALLSVRSDQLDTF